MQTTATPMKGCTMLVTLQRLGIVPSFSRPGVSNDNAYSESLFKTMKYGHTYPSKPFQSLEKTRDWVKGFVDWYNNDHLHSGISFTTPNSRHEGEDLEILKRRHAVYQEAQEQHPSRWSGKTRNWEKMDTVEFHGLKVMRNFVRPNDVGWPSGRGDNYPETYRRSRHYSR